MRYYSKRLYIRLFFNKNKLINIPNYENQLKLFNLKHFSCLLMINDLYYLYKIVDYKMNCNFSEENSFSQISAEKRLIVHSIRYSRRSSFLSRSIHLFNTLPNVTSSTITTSSFLGHVY